MKPILILYFSGVGNTKLVAEEIMNAAGKHAEAEIYSVERVPTDFSFNDYSGAVIGFPTYHSEPALPMMEFIERVSAANGLPAFIFTTCGMYPENSLRLFAGKCMERNIMPIYYASYRCAATDGILLMQGMRRWQRCERGLQGRIEKDTGNFLKSMKTVENAVMPRYKWYAPLNYPNKAMGRAVTFSIYLHEEKCIGCGKCAADCPRGAIELVNGFPRISKEKCINCYRCIHHCPVLALSLSKKKAVRTVWEGVLEN